MDLDTEGTAEVLNGTARVDDTVAYAVRDGNSAGMRLGTVIGFEERQTWQGKPYRRMRVHVTRSSGDRGGHDTDYVGGVEIFQRVVKL
jgi:hypothetical protein